MGYNLKDRLKQFMSRLRHAFMHPILLSLYQTRNASFDFFYQTLFEMCTFTCYFLYLYRSFYTRRKMHWNCVHVYESSLRSLTWISERFNCPRLFMVYMKLRRTFEQVLHVLFVFNIWDLSLKFTFWILFKIDKVYMN